MVASGCRQNGSQGWQRCYGMPPEYFWRRRQSAPDGHVSFPEATNYHVAFRAGLEVTMPTELPLLGPGVELPSVVFEELSWLGMARLHVVR